MSTNNDCVEFRNFRLNVGIGIDSRELNATQELLISLKAGLKSKKSLYFIDDIENSGFDYSELARRYRKFIGNRHIGLIEKLAEDFAAIGLVEFDIPWIQM